VAELVDALASGASGLTAVKVRVLSWAPFLPMPINPAEMPGIDQPERAWVLEIRLKLRL
jgi:hypothetical protein